MTDFYDPGVHSGLKRCFDSGRTRPLEWRVSQLRGVASFLHGNEAAIARAVRADFGKPEAEMFLTETGYLAGETRHAIKNLHRWMKPRRVGVPLHYLPARAFVEREPLGVVLVIGAWNYPLQLCLAPLIGALAAGNCIVLKPSELAPATSNLLASTLHNYLDPEAVKVVEGGAEQIEVLLRHRFDRIFFTGSRQKGQEVMLAAARHLTPVTLELGGKCPCIVTEHADLRVAARRIVWAKFLNAGQTCVAPDYLLVHESVEERLSGLMMDALDLFYGPDPKSSPDYSRIVDGRNFLRLRELQHQGTFIAGGGSDESDLYIAPTIVRGVEPESPLMQEEIFGPVLPVISFPSLSKALEIVRRQPDPIAVYLFSRDRRELIQLREQTRSGGICCNDLLFQASIPDLPFGGRGLSGMGVYHGRAGFETFTSPRSVLNRTGFPDPDLRYPPYGAAKFSLLRKIVTMFS
ncbi:MAG: aldehyde dehydrogenase family protein [Chlorobiaceae bacterium]|nr:aldehyde dehydrogenase family protein [Chlorobiaceae bacterium]